MNDKRDENDAQTPRGGGDVSGKSTTPAPRGGGDVSGKTLTPTPKGGGDVSGKAIEPKEDETPEEEDKTSELRKTANN